MLEHWETILLTKLCKNFDKILQEFMILLLVAKHKTDKSNLPLKTKNKNRVAVPDIVNKVGSAINFF